MTVGGISLPKEGAKLKKQPAQTHGGLMWMLMQSRLIRRLSILSFFLAAACHSQPSITPTSGETDHQLNRAAADIPDGPASGRPDSAALSPTLGQRMDAKEQPPKK
jgi:hypothetical protein